jgi:hypothetical protein
MVSRPVSGVLSSASRRLGDHPSVRPTSGLPREGRTGRPYPTFGLAPGGVYRAARVAPGAGALLPHRFTLACAPVARGHRRSVLCGTVLRVAPTGCQPAPCPAEPRLSSTRSPHPRAQRRTAVTRPTHHRRQCATGVDRLRCRYDAGRPAMGTGRPSPRPSRSAARSPIARRRRSRPRAAGWIRRSCRPSLDRGGGDVGAQRPGTRPGRQRTGGAGGSYSSTKASSGAAALVRKKATGTGTISISACRTATWRASAPPIDMATWRSSGVV